MGVPKSLCKYYENRAVRRAVNALVDQLSGTDTPEMDWREARNYSNALLSAAQVRADFIEFLFKIWEKTYGQAQPERLAGEYFFWDYYNPRQIWIDGELSRCYYRRGDANEGGPSDVLGVELDHKGSLRLYVGRFDGNDDIIDLAGIDAPEGWEVQHYDGVGDYLVNATVSISNLCEDFTSGFERFVREAQVIVEFLMENPPAANAC